MSEIALKLIREAKETRATRLDLGNCELTKLAEALFELTWLEELILSNVMAKHHQNQWNGLESKLNDFKSLSPKIEILEGSKKN